MTALWTASEAMLATGGAATGEWTASGVSIDSRSVQPGDLFVALTGPNFDGHDFVAAALKAGAAAALVHRVPQDVATDAPLLVAGDTLEALRALGAASRRRSKAKVIAVTGSVGKTGTKEMLKLVLDGQGATHASVGSFNNHWGVPLSLARMPSDSAFAIFELGMNHPGEIAPLSALVQPHVAIVTTVEAVHMAFFGSTAEIADAKAEIFEGMAPGGIAVLNRDNPHFARLAAAARKRGVAVAGFGQHIESEARLLDCALDPDSSRVFALINDTAFAYRLGVPGLHWVTNSMAVLLAVDAAGGDKLKAAKALAAMAPPKGRGQRHAVRLTPKGSFTLIDESYNASPVSMRAAIATLATAKPAKQARRMAVLGDMLELGERSPALHAELAQPLVERGIDLVFTAGPLMFALHERLPKTMRGAHAASSDDLAPLICAQVRSGDVVMVKGSAGSRMGRVVQALLALADAPKRAANGD